MGTSEPTSNRPQNPHRGFSIRPGVCVWQGSWLEAPSRRISHGNGSMGTDGISEYILSSKSACAFACYAACPHVCSGSSKSRRSSVLRVCREPHRRRIQFERHKRNAKWRHIGPRRVPFDFYVLGRSCSDARGSRRSPSHGAIDIAFRKDVNAMGWRRELASSLGREYLSIGQFNSWKPLQH